MASLPSCLIIACALLVLWTGAAAGHKVNVLAYVEGDQVVVEGYFSAKAKAMNCQVEVLDAEGKKLHEGKTDAQGMYRFPVSVLGTVSGDVKIMLHAGMGHQAECVLRASEFGRAASDGQKEPETRPAGEAPATKPESTDTERPRIPAEEQAAASLTEKVEPPPETKKASSSPVISAVQARQASDALRPAVAAQPADIAALTKALEAALDRKIDPLIRMLGQQQKMLMEQKERGPTLSDIVGGIGWILGLVGVTAFFLGCNRSSGRGPSA